MSWLRKARVWLLGAIAITVSVVAVLHASGRESGPESQEAAAALDSVQAARGFFAALREELDAEQAGLQQAGPDERAHARAMLARGDALFTTHGHQLTAREREDAARSLEQLRGRLDAAAP